jgi:hypothetical protein
MRVMRWVHCYRLLIARVFATRGDDWRMVPVFANGQPSVAAYCRGDGPYELHILQVFTVTPAGYRIMWCSRMLRCSRRSSFRPRLDPSNAS